jgi:hypothetical protein
MYLLFSLFLLYPLTLLQNSIFATGIVLTLLDVVNQLVLSYKSCYYFYQVAALFTVIFLNILSYCLTYPFMSVYFITIFIRSVVPLGFFS